MNLALEGRLHKRDKQHWAGGKCIIYINNKAQVQNYKNFKLEVTIHFLWINFLNPTDLLI